MKLDKQTLEDILAVLECSRIGSKTDAAQAVLEARAHATADFMFNPTNETWQALVRAERAVREFPVRRRKVA